MCSLGLLQYCFLVLDDVRFGYTVCVCVCVCADSHPRAFVLSKCFPMPRGKIAQLLLSYGNDSVDVRGVVALVDSPANKANKMDVPDGLLL